MVVTQIGQTISQARETMEFEEEEERVYWKLQEEVFMKVIRSINVSGNRLAYNFDWQIE